MPNFKTVRFSVYMEHLTNESNIIIAEIQKARTVDLGIIEFNKYIENNLEKFIEFLRQL